MVWYFVFVNSVILPFLRFGRDKLNRYFRKVYLLLSIDLYYCLVPVDGLFIRCDLVVLPSSFPFGGMENPCLIFVTPTLLAGDKSLANVITHEIAHSWTGNLVTNANWEHFWFLQIILCLCYLFSLPLP